MAKLTIPLNSGCHEETDQRLSKDGQLRTVRNGRLDREGRIRVRAGYTALSSKLSAGSSAPLMVAYDLASLNSRLLALGDVDERPAGGSLGPGYAVDLFEYTGLTEQPWRSSTGRITASAARRLPSATSFRNLNVLGDTPGGARDACCAALGGYVLMGWDTFDAGPAAAPITARAFARIVKADTTQLLDHDLLTTSLGSAHWPIEIRCAAMTSRLVATFVDKTSTTRRNIYGVSWRVGTDITGVLKATPLLSGGASDVGLHATCSINAGDGIVVATVYPLASGTIRVRQFDNTLTVVVPSSGQYADIVLPDDPTSMVVEADVTSDTLTVVLVRNFDLRIYSYVLSTGATIGVPPYGATTQGADDLQNSTFALGVCRYSASTIAISMYVIRNVVPASTSAVRIATYNPVTHDETSYLGTVIRDAAPASTPVLKNGELIMAVARGANANTDIVLVSIILTSAGGVTDPAFVSPLAAPDMGVAGRIVRFPSDLTRDATTGKYYWLRGLLNSSQQKIPEVTEFELGSTERRQMAEMAGSLYISGGVVTQYDGKTLTEASWLERPRILSITGSNSTGSLDNNHTYTYVETWDYVDANGDLSQGPVSDPFEVTMGAADDTATIVGSIPLSMRLNTASNSFLAGHSIRVRFWRNTVDVVDTVETPSALFQVVGTVDLDQLQLPGATLSFEDTMSDDTLADQEVLYTQVQSPLDNHASQPAKYLSTGNECIMASGLPDANLWNVSKPLQPSETVNWAQNGTLAFEGRVQRGELEQAMGFAQSWLLATQRELWTLNGTGPDIRGIGEFQRQYRIPSDGGMREGGWKSVVEFGKGVLFQLADDQIYLWSGGAPKPVGLEIQDTLLEFPNVVAACHVKNAQSVALALQNDDGNDGCIVLWDQVTDQWFRDDVGAVDALAEHDGRLAYLQDGIVYLEDDDYGTGTAVELTLSTGNVAKNGSAGAGGVERMLVTGVYQGDCTLELGIKYTDDQGFTSLGTQSLLASDGYSAGDPFDLEFAPNRDDVSRFELELTVTSTATNTKQAWCNAIEVHYTTDDGPKRMGDARRR